MRQQAEQSEQKRKATLKAFQQKVVSATFSPLILQVKIRVKKHTTAQAAERDKRLQKISVTTPRDHNQSGSPLEESIRSIKSEQDFARLEVRNITGLPFFLCKYLLDRLLLLFIFVLIFLMW